MEINSKIVVILKKIPGSIKNSLTKNKIGLKISLKKYI